MKITALKNQGFKTVALKLCFALLLLFLFVPNSTTHGKFYAIVDRPEYIESLQAESDALLSLFDEMPSVAVFVDDRPIQASGTSIDTGVAFTSCETSEKPVIYLKKDFYEKTNRKQLVNILKHELTHAWACRQNVMGGHDELFRRKFTSVGGFGN